MIFSKEEQPIVSYWQFFHETKEILENISLMFSSCNHSILALQNQTHFIITSESWLSSFKQNSTSILGFL